MRPREYKTYLAVAGMPEETTREEASEFFKEWETTVSNKASMRTLVNLLVTKTATKLGLLNFVTYYPTRFIRDIQTMAFGLNAATAWQRSRMELSIANKGRLCISRRNKNIALEPRAA